MCSGLLALRMALPDTFPSRQTTDRPVIARVSRTPTCTVQGEGGMEGIRAPRVQSTQLLEPDHTGILGRGWSVCSVLLHRAVSTNGPLLRADALRSQHWRLFVDWRSDRPSTSAISYSPLGSLEDVNYESSTAQTFDCFFLPEETLEDVSWQTTARDNVSGHPHAPGRRNHGSMLSRRRRHHSTCAHPKETLASARTAAQENRVRHNCFVERQRNGNSERAVASNKTVKNIDVELGGALVDLHQAQLRHRRLHVCVATRRRAVWTRGAVSTASCPPPN